MVLPPADSDMAAQVFKDPYLFDFLGTADLRREREVEQALMDHIQRFLLELGAGFAFMGRQVHLEVESEDFYLDLLFYHVKLRREGGRPVFVRTGAGVPRGNTELLRKGAKPFPSDALTSSLKDVLHAAIATSAEIPATSLKTDVVAVEEPPVREAAAATYPESPVEAGADRMPLHEAPTLLPPSVYEAVKPLILNALDKPRKLDDLVKILKVRKTQLQCWVKHLLEEGIIEERTIRKSKKLAIGRPDEKLRLS